MPLHLGVLEVSHNSPALSRIKALTAGQPPACRARECFARGGFMVGELKYVHEPPLSRRLRVDGHLDSVLERLQSSILSGLWQRLRCDCRVSARLWLESEKLQPKSRLELFPPTLWLALGSGKLCKLSSNAPH
jgi:hypothetical protein